MSLDSTYKPAYRVRVISWNILHDNNATGNHALQADRLSGIAEVLNSYTLDTPTLIYLCEVASAENFDSLASKLPGQKSLGYTPYPNDYMGFLTNISGVGYSQIYLPKMKIRWPKTKAVVASAPHFSVAGIHQPDPKGWNGTKARLAVIKLALKASAEPSLIVGDFNALFFQPSRLLLWLRGYRRAKSDWPNPSGVFPSPLYRGKNLPRLTPSISIDEQYYTGMQLERRQSINTKLSDHPIAICDYVITS